ncbi:MAG: metallophosphoesterase [Lentisphaeria bacterium]|nr:metallophosphoesterase [Lentisphaeria bacterium]
MIALFAFLSAAFVIWRAVLTIPGKHPVWKVAAAVMVTVAAFKFQILHAFGGAMYFAPDLPRGVLLVGAYVYAVHFIFFFLLLFSECCRMLVRCAVQLVRRKIPESYHRAGRWINLILFAVAVISAAVGMMYGTAFPELREVTFEIPGLPRRADGLKIVWLTDLHVDAMSDPERIEHLVAKVNSLKPDLVLLGGDLVDGRVAALGYKLLPLAGLEARFGVYGVPGNHEYYSGYYEWMSFFENQCKVRMLVNTSHSPGCGIFLVGVGDAAGKRNRAPEANFRQAFKDVGSDDAVILLAHRPDIVHCSAKMEVMLQLSGHTHGGMISGFDRIVRKVNGGFVSGKYTVGNTRLYVSNGTGIWSGFPIRLGRKAEITLIKLERD